jgi:hypothetical protein
MSRERRLALAGRAGQVGLDRRAPLEQRVELVLRRVAQRPLCSMQTHEHLPCPLGARLALDRGDACGLRRLERGTFELGDVGAGLTRVRLRLGELRAHLLEQAGTRLPPEAEPLRRRSQPVEDLHRLLALARRVGELLLGAAALGKNGLELLLGGPARERRRRLAAVGLGEPVVECREIELRDPRAQLRDLAAKLLRALGRGRLQRQRPQPLAHLLLEIACALDLRRDTRELQLRPVPARLEAAEAGGLLNQCAPFLRLRREDRLDLPLPDDRVHALTEPEVGEELDEVEPPHGRAIDEVLPLAAAVEPARDRQLGEVDRQRAVLVVEQELDLAEVLGLPVRRAREEHVVGLLGAQLVRAERAGGPADRVGDVRLARAVRPDDHADARLEADLDRVRERLEATELDGAEMHRRAGYR